MIRGAVAALALGLASPASGADPHDYHYPQKMLLKNWALADCIAHAYGSKPVEDDATKSAGGYFEFGKAGPRAYRELDALVQQYLAKDYPSIHGGQLNTMKCIDLYNSRALDRLARRYRNGGGADE